ncbi:MAG: single-stranded DNA-binding protein [Blastopirellula sp.]|nr:MAG: single-stranded DNA-binding protein [Blastopirellula sp.]
MASFNRVILVGNLTRDVDVKYLQSGTAVTELGLAVNDRRKNQSGEWVDETTFVDVTLWGRTAEVAGEYLSKGSSVLVEGRLKLDTWETDGQKRSKLRVVGEKMQMLGAKGGGGGGGGSRQTSGDQSYQGGGQQGGGQQQSYQGGQQQNQPSSSYDNGGGGGSQIPEDDIPF